MKDDISFKFNKEMFKMFLTGREITIGQVDGSKWHFKLDMTWKDIKESISEVEQAVLNLHK